MSDNRTDLPSPSAPNFNQRLRETIQTYLGRQGNPLDRGLTLRDLTETGLLKLRDGFTLKSGGGSSTLPLEPGPGLADEPDLTPPPTPTGLTATAAISHIIIEHDAPVYTQGRGHLRTRLYGRIVNAGDPLPTFADAVEIAQFDGSVYAHPSNPATTWRFWIKWETIDNVLSIDPAGGTNGVEAITGQDVSKLVFAMTGPGNPFKVVTEQLTLPDGTVVPVGTYTADAFIHNGQITNAKIANLAVDSAKIASVSADKITTGSIAVGQYIQSAGYIAGSTGWRINGDGNAELSNAVVRGTVYASAGSFSGDIYASNGWFRGSVNTGSYYGYAWPTDGGGGAHLSSSGLLVGNANLGKYFQITSDGNVYAPGFSIVNGAATFSGALSAATGTFSGELSSASGSFAGSLSAATGTFSGTLTASAVNAVDTINLAGQAVTIPVSAYTSGNITIPGSTETTVQSVSLVSTGAPIFLLFTANIKNGTVFVEAGDSDYYTPVPTEIRIYRGTTRIQTTSFSEGGAMAVTIKDTADAGSVTYYAKAYSIGGTQVDGSSDAVVSARSLFLLETKR